MSSVILGRNDTGLVLETVDSIGNQKSFVQTALTLASYQNAGVPYESVATGLLACIVNFLGVDATGGPQSIDLGPGTVQVGDRVAMVVNNGLSDYRINFEPTISVADHIKLLQTNAMNFTFLAFILRP